MWSVVCGSNKKVYSVTLRKTLNDLRSQGKWRELHLGDREFPRHQKTQREAGLPSRISQKKLKT